jgi:hypothetical protein
MGHSRPPFRTIIIYKDVRLGSAFAETCRFPFVSESEFESRHHPCHLRRLSEFSE